MRNYKIEIHKYAPELNKLWFKGLNKPLNIPHCTDIKAAKIFLGWIPAQYPGYTRVKLSRKVMPVNSELTGWTKTISGVLVNQDSRRALLEHSRQPLSVAGVYTATHTIKFS